MAITSLLIFLAIVGGVVLLLEAPLRKKDCGMESNAMKTSKLTALSGAALLCTVVSAQPSGPAVDLRGV